MEQKGSSIEGCFPKKLGVGKAVATTAAFLLFALLQAVLEEEEGCHWPDPLSAHSDKRITALKSRPVLQFSVPMSPMLPKWPVEPIDARIPTEVPPPPQGEGVFAPLLQVD